MKDKNRWAIALVIIVGAALVLCAGMVIGGAAVYGVLRFDDARSSRDAQETWEQQIEEMEEGELQAEQLMPQLEFGVVIAEVAPGSPAEEAGLEVGDLVSAVDGQEIGADGNLAAIIAEYEPGDRVVLQVQGQGDQEPRAVRVTLGDDPDAAGKAYLGAGYYPAVLQGLPLEEMIPFRGQGEWVPYDLPLPEVLGGAGVVVMSVIEGSPADIAGLEHGDVITSLDGEPLDRAQALFEALATREPGDTVTLGVLHTGDEAPVELQVRLSEHPEREGAAYLGVTVRNVLGLRRFQGRPFRPEATPEPPPP